MTKTINWWPKPHIERIDTSLSFCFLFCSNIYLNIFFMGGGSLFYELCVQAKATNYLSSV